MARKPSSPKGINVALAKAAMAPAKKEITFPATVCRAVARDFKERGITHVGAAKMLEIEPKAVANQVSGNRPFSKKSAKLYAKVFGYSEPYLLTGEGSLMDEKKEKKSVGMNDVVSATVSLDQYKALEMRVAILEKFITMMDVTDKSPVKISAAKGGFEKGIR